MGFLQQLFGFGTGQADGPLDQHEADEQRDVHADQEVIPEVCIERIESHVSGSHLELWGTFRNRSSVEIEIREIRMFGSTDHETRFMKPGEQHEMRIYSGELLHSTNEHDAEVVYEAVETGRYYTAKHRLDFMTHGDGSVEISRVTLVRPIEEHG